MTLKTSSGALLSSVFWPRPFCVIIYVAVTVCQNIDENNSKAIARIKGGYPAPRDRFPYMCSLRDRDSKEHACGAVLIRPKWVLTAAHCVDPNNKKTPGLSPIVACDIYKRTRGDPLKEYAVADTIMFGSWDGKVETGDDIALIKLKTKAHITEFPGLDIPGNTHHASDIVVALGWGIRGATGRQLSTKLQMAANLRYVNWKVCNEDDWWSGIIKECMCCAYASKQDACEGDSGGPLLQADTSHGEISYGTPRKDLLIGITSFGTADCNGSFPGVYASVSFYANWINCILEGKDKKKCLKKHLLLHPKQNSTEPSEPGTKEETVVDRLCGEVKPSKNFNKTQALDRIQTAIKNDNSALVKKVLCQSLDPNTTIGPVQESLLSTAAAYDSIESTIVLAEFEEDMESKDLFGKTPVCDAAYCGSLHVLEYLLKHGVNVNVTDYEHMTPLHYAIRGNGLKIVKILVSKHPDIEAKDSDGNTPLKNAVLLGSPNIAEVLLINNASVTERDYNNHTSLHDVAYHDSPEIAKKLIEAGAKLEAKDLNGATPLESATRYESKDVLGVLLNNNVNLNAKDDLGCTSLHEAVYHNYLEIVKALVDGGADIEARDLHGSTPLHIACYWGSTKAVEMLLSVDAAFDVVDEFGHTPLHFASSGGYLPIVKALTDKGASVNIRDSFGNLPVDVICVEKVMESGCDIRSMQELRNRLQPVTTVLKYL